MGIVFTMICQECGTYGSANIVQIVSASTTSVTELGFSGLPGPGNLSSFTLTPVPEPATFVLLLLAAISLAILFLQRRRPV